MSKIHSRKHLRWQSQPLSYKLSIGKKLNISDYTGTRIHIFAEYKVTLMKLLQSHQPIYQSRNCYFIL